MKYVRLLMKSLALILLLTALFTNHILPPLYLIVIGSVEILLLFLVWRKKILQLFVVLLIIISSFGLLYSESIIARLVTYNPMQTNTVSFFTLKESPILTIKSALNKKITLSSLVEPELTVVIKSELKKQGYKQELSSYEGIYDGVQQLYAGTVDVVVLDEAYIDTILFLDKDFLTKTKVIWAVKNTVKRIPIVSNKDVLNEAFTILISGNDKAGELQAKGLSDVDLLMTVNPKTHVVEMVTVPRDAFLPMDKVACNVPANITNTLDKLTHTGVQGGIPCTIKTLETTFNIKIDYFVHLNFTSFKNMIDALGTVTVYNEFPFTSDVSKKYYSSGMLTLTGLQALDFARERKAFTTGDFQRGKNQQELIKGIAKKVTELSTLIKIDKIVNAISGTIDTNFKPEEIMALARMQIQNLSFNWTLNSHIMKATPENSTTMTYPNNILSIQILNPASIAETRKFLVDNLVIPEVKK